MATTPAACASSSFAVLLLGCPPGEEVSALPLQGGQTEKVSFKVKAGEQIHLWEDFEYRATGEKWSASRRRCYQWEITSSLEGDEEETLTTCWALEGSRCDSVVNKTRHTNCEVQDCVIKVPKSGKLELHAKLSRVEDCGMDGKSVLRVRRVSP